MSETFANQAVSTLSAAIATTTATTCTVVDATSFPASGTFRIKIDSEILIVTGVDGFTFTITRGAEGTAAATHASGANVIHLLTKGGLEARVANRFVTDLYDNKPAAGVKGRFFLPTDGLFLEYDDGATWHKYGPCRYLKAPPQTGWEWVNQGDATATFVGSTLVVEDTSIDSTNPDLRLYVRKLIGPEGRIIAAFALNGLSNDAPKGGICFRNPVNGAFQTWGLRPSSSQYYQELHFVEYNSPTSIDDEGSSYNGLNIWPQKLWWVKCEWSDGASGSYKNISFSQDGINWIEWVTNTSGDWQPLQAGVFVDATENRGPVSVSLVHWEES